MTQCGVFGANYIAPYVLDLGFWQIMELSST